MKDNLKLICNRLKFILEKNRLLISASLGTAIIMSIISSLYNLDVNLFSFIRIALRIIILKIGAELLGEYISWKFLLKSLFNSLLIIFIICILFKEPLMYIILPLIIKPSDFIFYMDNTNTNNNQDANISNSENINEDANYLLNKTHRRLPSWKTIGGEFPWTKHFPHGSMGQICTDHQIQYSVFNSSVSPKNFEIGVQNFGIMPKYKKIQAIDYTIKQVYKYNVPEPPETYGLSVLHMTVIKKAVSAYCMDDPYMFKDIYKYGNYNTDFDIDEFFKTRGSKENLINGLFKYRSSFKVSVHDHH